MEAFPKTFCYQGIQKKRANMAQPRVPFNKSLQSLWVEVAEMRRGKTLLPQPLQGVSLADPG